MFHEINFLAPRLKDFSGKFFSLRLKTFLHVLKKDFSYISRNKTFWSSDYTKFFFSSKFFFFKVHRTFFTLTAFFTAFVRYFVFVLLLRYRECCRFERDCFTPRRFLSYTSWRHLAQHAFDFRGSRQFFPEGSRASHWGSKLIVNPCVRLNHTVLSKRNSSVSYIYALRSYRTLLSPLCDNCIYCKVHIISTRWQKFLRSNGLEVY